jgi:uncharacterized protein (DUF1800 family)
MLGTMRTQPHPLRGGAALARRLRHRSDAACAAGRSAALSGALNRITWGVNHSAYQQAAKWATRPGWNSSCIPPRRAAGRRAGADRCADHLAKTDAATGAGTGAQRRDYDKAMADDEAKKAAQRAYQQELNRLAKEAATRSLLRDLYSPNQLQEQMTWFWMNHFSVHQGKANLRAMVGDYEDNAIRPHALGKFRDLLSATLHHPAMIRYLDNEQNAANRINENYAREIMELHTLGVDGGYTRTMCSSWRASSPASASTSATRRPTSARTSKTSTCAKACSNSIPIATTTPTKSSSARP